MTEVRRDRLRELVDTVLGALDDRLDGGELAGRAFLSRFHFDRLVSAGLGEAPAAFRRRLLLERAGRDFPETTDRSLAGLRTRWASAGEEFLSLVRGIRDRGEWADVFVDALCEPPQSFTFGGVVAHVVTHSAYRRQVLIGALAELGVTVADTADPIEWERMREVSRPHPADELRGTS